LRERHGARARACFNLVAPLSGDLASTATDTRVADTSGQLDLFSPAGSASGAVSPRIGLQLGGLRRGDVESAIDRSTPPTTTTPGSRTSTTATRTTGTRTTGIGGGRSAGRRDSGFLFADVHAAYLDCRRNKGRTASALAFAAGIEANLLQLHEDLADGVYVPGPSTCFVIRWPRPREVWAAGFRDRVVHHAIYRHIGARFENAFIANSCACIPGRGTLYAAQRLEGMVRSITQNWSRPVHYLKMDLANFFVSIDKRILFALLAARVHEAWWRDLVELVVFHDPREGAVLHGRADDLDLIPPHKSLFSQPLHLGLPIGNLSSQFFANVYLDVLDQFVKHRLRARHYVRYVDDFILLHESPQQLNAWRAEIEAFVAERLRVHVNPAKTVLQPIDRGIDFVGHVLKPWRRTCRPRTLNHALHRLEEMPAEDVYAAANSYLGMVRQASHSVRDRARICNVVRRRGLSVDHSLTKAYP
jgi:RNA-directed DNA polymerase